jgi:Uma2 family endonuclease
MVLVMATQPVTKISEEEYLRLERAAEYKSEYIGGEIFAMPGGSLRHSALAAKWITEFNIRLQGRRVSVYTSDARVRTPSTGSYVYPDVSVVLGEPVTYADSDDILTNPTVVVEVLSPSTSNYDHGKKFELYCEIPSLTHYILVHTDAMRVEHYARQSDGIWAFHEYKGDDDTMALDSINCSIRLGDVYTNPPT